MAGGELEDDPRIWSTARSDAVELRVVSELARPAPMDRVLEVGVGTGRLIEILGRRSSEIVAVDYNPDHLRLARDGAGPRTSRTSWLVADGHRLPFAAGSFSTVVMVRVLHRTPAPRSLLSEARRVLRPDGSLILAYYPRPSLRTFQFTLWRTLRKGPGSRGERPALPRGGRDLPTTDEPPPWSTAQTERAARDVGFEIEESIGTGLEEVSLLGRLPTSFFLGLARNLPRAPGYPTRFARLRAVGSGATHPAPAAVVTRPDGSAGRTRT